MPLFAEDAARFSVVVAHRRCGKTVASLQRGIAAAMMPPSSSARYAYIAPLRNQAKNIAWDLAKSMTKDVPGMGVNESELRLDFPTGARLQLYGSDNPDALRGGWLDGVIMDEVAQMPPNTWTHVVRPMLADRQGWAVFIGTPSGKDYFYDLWEQAGHKQGWTRYMYRAEDTGYVLPEELADAKAAMSENAYAQEFDCSFTAAVRGAFYGRAMDQIEQDGHMLPIDRDPSLPVTTSWDLGVRDSTSIWVWQPYKGNAWAVIDYYEATGEGVDHYAAWLEDHGYRLNATHLAPHDIANTDWSSAGGKSRMMVAADHGINFQRVRRPTGPQEVMEQINALRLLLPRCYFHADDDERGARVYQGRHALSLYRQDFNERLGALKATPLHDWTSHAADAARTFAAHYEDQRSVHAPGISRPTINIRAASARARRGDGRRGTTLGYSRGN